MICTGMGGIRTGAASLVYDVHPCRDALAEIDVLVDTSAAEGQSLENGTAASGNGGVTEVEGGVEALGPFFRANEGFRGQIRAEVLAAALSQVCSASQQPLDKIYPAPYCYYVPHTHRVTSFHLGPPESCTGSLRASKSTCQEACLANSAVAGGGSRGKSGGRAGMHPGPVQHPHHPWTSWRSRAGCGCL